MAGNIKIIEPRDHFQKVSNAIIFSEDVDFGTLGIYVKILALGKKWQLNIEGLAKVLKISADRVRRAFSVLEGAGYLRRSRSQGDDGKFTGWDYEVYYTPVTVSTDTPESPTSGNHRHRENTDVGKTPTSGKSGGINKDSNNINKDYNYINKDSNNTPFIPPTAEQISDYCRSRGWSDPEGFAAHFVDYYGTGEHPWHLSNGKPMRDWRKAVITWEPNNKFRSFTPAAPSQPIAPQPRAPKKSDYMQRMYEQAKRLGIIKEEINGNDNDYDK